MSGWVIGWAIGGVVVLAVVVLLGMMIAGASRAAAHAEDIVAALQEAQANTEGLWKLADTNRTAARIVEGAATVRESATPVTDGSGGGAA